MTRPPDRKPATAYDRRRYLTLVQVLAMEDNANAALTLCELWGIIPVTNCSTPALNTWATLRQLAQHVVEYHSSEREEQDA